MKLTNNLKEVMECKDSARLKKFATSPNPDERQFAAANKYIDEDTQMILTRDDKINVKKTLGINPSITRQVAEALIEDKNSNVKAAVIYNPNVAEEVKLAVYGTCLKDNPKEKDYLICTRALAKCLKTPAMLKGLSHSTDCTTRIYAANNKYLPEDALNNMRTDVSAEIRVLVAQSPKTTPETLKYLSEDSNFRVRRAVAENENTPIEILQNMADNAREPYFIINEAKINMASRSVERDLEEVKDVDDIEAEI